MNSAWNPAAAVPSPICPQGHPSSDVEYCSECGSKMARSPYQQTQATPADRLEACPDCGTPREHDQLAYCEVCGYNFSTGAHGEIAPVESSDSSLSPDSSARAETKRPDEPVEQAANFAWVVTLHETAAPDASGAVASQATPAPSSFVLEAGQHLVGRKDLARGIDPAIDVTQDEAVSRRHALLIVTDDHRLLLRDIQSANGTTLNGRALEPMRDEPLQEGDKVALGRCTQLWIGRRG